MNNRKPIRCPLAKKTSALSDITDRDIRKFRSTVYSHYRRYARALPWRKTRNPYRILVSEIMLQQTPVDRVADKYMLFIKTFPDFSALSRASLADVLRVWQGLGYNRRAVSLCRLASSVIRDHHGKLPNTREGLMRLQGIGAYTAAAILAFAFNKPELFIETNIRSVFIHFFFEGRQQIRDSDIMPLLEATLDADNPREWYNALMDYGAILKRDFHNPGRKSSHHQRQTPFNGSNRQMRGLVLRCVIQHPGITKKGLMQRLHSEPDKIKAVLKQLSNEGFIKKTIKGISIA